MRVILINGDSGSGKDTIAKYITNKVNDSCIIPNSYGVKHIAQGIFNIDPEKKSEITRFTCDKITEIGYKIDKYYWEKIAYDRIASCGIHYKGVVIVPDFRIYNTYSFYTQEVKAEVITIRLDGGNKRKSKQEETPTEYDNNLNTRIKFDYTINTDENTLEETYSIINKILYDLNMLKNIYICKYATIEHNKLICPYSKNNIDFVNKDIEHLRMDIRCPNDVSTDRRGVPICMHISEV